MTELVKKYLEIRDKNDKAFFIASGGDGDQAKRQSKRKAEEDVLILQMTEQEMEEVYKSTADQFLRMYVSNLRKKI